MYGKNRFNIMENKESEYRYWTVACRLRQKGTPSPGKDKTTLPSLPPAVPFDADGARELGEFKA